jgi:ABC-type transport system involved in cytochrome c biogenesis permease component
MENTGVLVLVGLYFLPALLALARSHHQRLAIAALNLLLGWTVLGWVVALVWALTATPRR